MLYSPHGKDIFKGHSQVTLTAMGVLGFREMSMLLKKFVNVYYSKLSTGDGGPAGAQTVKLDLNKKSFPKQKTIQDFTIDAQGFRKTKNENPPTWKMGVTS